MTEISGKKYSVMVVDDSSLTRQKLSMMLAEMGHNVVKNCRNGTEAVASYAELRPDLVTMDITMPDMDGIEATRKIISEDRLAKIIMVTSHGQEQMVLEALDAGARGYVLKPFKAERIAVVIEKAMAASSL